MKIQHKNYGVTVERYKRQEIYILVALVIFRKLIRYVYYYSNLRKQ